MRYALISDVHGNAPALARVLEDAAREDSYTNETWRQAYDAFCRNMGIENALN